MNAEVRYVSDLDPGYRRVRNGRGFDYLDTRGQRITNQREVARIRALAIPPAWTDVWIAPDPTGHIQAVGRDARRRKQYRYHPAWRQVRDTDKYARMLRFAHRLPRIRAEVEQDLSRPGLPREKILALVVRLLELTHQRVGNEEYARLNRSYGLTTLRARHANVEGGRLRLRFRGKSGKQHEVGIRDRRVVALVRRLQDLPGQHLFAYLDPDGIQHDIRSDDVNAYLRTIAGIDVSAKDFRTWAATLLAFRTLRARPSPSSPSRDRRTIRAAMEQVADQLGNTATVCRSSYVDPAVVRAWEDGRLARLRVGPATDDPGTDRLTAEEAALVRLLARGRRAARGAAASSAG